jgi:hypothetical protein
MDLLWVLRCEAVLLVLLEGRWGRSPLRRKSLVRLIEGLVAGIMMSPLLP